MSSFALTALAGISQRALDGVFRTEESQTGETTVQFGDGVHGAELPLSSRPVLDGVYAGSGAGGNVAANTRKQPELLMRSGYTGGAFDSGRHYSSVLMQQGRVQTDADYHEVTGVDRWRALLGERPAFDVATADGDSGSSSGFRLSALALEPEASSRAIRLGDITDNEVLVALEPGQVRDPFVVATLWDSAAAPPTSHAAEGIVGPEVQKDVSSHLDSMSEMGEMESLRLQMAMDRLSKMVSTLSNVLQKIDATEAAITHNIK